MVSNTPLIWISTLDSQYHKQKNEKKQFRGITSTELQFEIECPRCSEMMALCSSFDSLYYFCEACNFHLYTQTKNTGIVLVG
jgi:uncharacterized protein (DUF983 family)